MSWFAAIPVVGEFVDKIGSVIDDVTTTDEERLKAKNELAQLISPVMQAILAAQAKFDEMRLQLQLAEVQSGDRFVRWTRPLMTWLTFIAWAYCLVTDNANTEMAFYAFGLIGGIFSATRGAEKMVGKWANGNGNGNGKNSH